MRLYGELRFQPVRRVFVDKAMFGGFIDEGNHGRQLCRAIGRFFGQHCSEFFQSGAKPCASGTVPKTPATVLFGPFYGRFVICHAALLLSLARLGRSRHASIETAYPATASTNRQRNYRLLKTGILLLAATPLLPWRSKTR